jgi:hypothetical protein
MPQGAIKAFSSVAIIIIKPPDIRNGWLSVTIPQQ